MVDNDAQKKEDIEGILLINKPVGPSSYQVVRMISRRLKIQKIGYVGTLDPLAKGLLPIVIGRKYTKLSDKLMIQNKRYLVTARFFEATNTGDLEGKIIRKDQSKILTKQEIEQAFSLFNGFSYYQIPPLYSAIKVNGKKLYEYARKNQKVTLSPRSVTIFEISLLNYNSITNLFEFVVYCGKGTYIRSLVMDIANKLNTVAVVVDLCRISSGDFHIQQTVSLEEVSLNNIHKLLIKS